MSIIFLMYSFVFVDLSVYAQYCFIVRHLFYCQLILFFIIYMCLCYGHMFRGINICVVYVREKKRDNKEYSDRN